MSLDVKPDKKNRKSDSESEEKKKPDVKLTKLEKKLMKKPEGYHGPMPKKAMTPYFFFMMEVTPKMKADYPNLKLTEVTSKIGSAWSAMTEKQKAPYQKMQSTAKAMYFCK